MLTRGVQHYGRRKEAIWASGGLFVEPGETTIHPPQLSRHKAQKHDEVHRCCRRARHVHDSRSYTPCSQDTGAYLRAAAYLMGRARGRSPSPQSFSEDFSNVGGEFREVRSPATPSSPKERALKNTWYLYIRYLVPGTRYSSARYSCVRVLYFKALPFAASSSYGNFLSAGLGSSPIYSSLISVCKA